MLNEAFALIEDGCITPQDLDKAITHGLGLRWSVVGPFETIDLNAARGLRHYVEIFGAKYFDMMKSRGARPWDERVVTEVDRAMRATLPLTDIPSRQAWRDRQLTRLAVLKLRRKRSKTHDYRRDGPLRAPFHIEAKALGMDVDSLTSTPGTRPTSIPRN